MSFALSDTRRCHVVSWLVALGCAAAPPLAAAGATDGTTTGLESIATSSQAASGPTATQPGRRPKVCLVLSGGGARGAAHVGVLKVLEELRVPIDCIAGTSMGALVGASYASGSTIAEMEGMVGSLTTETLFNDDLPRQDRDIRRKQDDYTNLFGAEFGLRGGELRMAKGLVSGIQIETVLRRLARVHGVARFDDLPIPFRAVATDLTTGLPVVFGDGELAAVMRASMSVPGAVAPAEIDGKLLVDGGLTDNLPVGVARAMGAEIVIAVNLGTPLLKRDALGSLFGVTEQMINILTEQNVRGSLASLKPTDILIQPELGDHSAGDFSGMMSTIPFGVEAARRVGARLSALAVDADAYAAWRERRRSTEAQDRRPVDAIRVEGVERVNPAYVEQLIDTRPGAPVEARVIDRDLQRLYGTGDFEHVNYRILEDNGRRTLALRALEKSWGPDYLRLGLGLNSDFRGNSYYNLLARHRRTWINSLGGEWRTELQFGRVDRLFTEFYQPLTIGRGLFVAPSITLEQRPIDLFSGSTRLARFLARYWLAGIDVGSELNRSTELRVGYRGGRLRGELETGALAGLDDSRERIGLVQARLFFDQLDSISFPRAGQAALVELTGSRRSLGGDKTSTRGDLSATLVRSFGDHTLNGAFRVSRPTGSSRVATSDVISWGGFLQQSGYPTGSLAGESLAFGRIVYYNKLVKQTLLEGLYAGFSLEAGRIDKPLVPGGPDGLLKSAALFFGLDSPIGPLYIAYGRAADGSHSYYLFLGKP